MKKTAVITALLLSLSLAFPVFASGANANVHRSSDAEVQNLSETICRSIKKTVSTGSAADEKIIWKFLYDKIGNEYGVAGLMGNLYAESALRSDNLQNSYESKLGYNDKTYTEAVDDGSYAKFINDAAGYGLAQWTFWTRKKALQNYVRKNGASIGDLNAQLEFLWIELTTSFTSTLDVLKNAKSVSEASDNVLTEFECPADQSDAMKARRSGYGEKYYDKYAGKIEPEKGDLVSITGATYINGKKIPAWVLGQNWYVRSIKGERIVIDKSEDGKHSIKSAVSSGDITIIKQANTADDKKETENGGKKAIDDIAKEVINGLWGKGAARKSKLESAGYDYKTVQRRVNEIWKQTH